MWLYPILVLREYGLLVVKFLLLKEIGNNLHLCVHVGKNPNFFV